MKIPFATQSYRARALPFSAQRLVNYFAEAGPDGARNSAVLYNAPGIKDFADGLAGALRGFAVMAGVFYAVAGNKFYSIDSAGAETLIGSINTAVGPVSMAANRASPQELCFVDGTDGWTYDTTNGLREITDADFKAADTVTFQDGYLIFNRTGTSEFFISAIDDARSYVATDFADAESSPTNIVAVYSNHQQLWVFKEDKIEVHYNSGNADFPFERMAGGVVERGCAAAFSVAADDNTLFWLGDDRIVYRAAGFTPQRVSTHAIEEQLSKMTDVSDALGFFVTIGGHKFYHLIFPTGRACFVYDAATQRWHERESFEQRHWRGGTYVQVYGKHLVGDAFQGRVGELDMDTYTEFGGVMHGIMAAPPVHGDVHRIFHARLTIDIEAGVGVTGGGDPQMWLDWSDDGGHTFSSRKPARGMGAQGDYRQRAYWTRLGSARERVYRLTTAAAVKRTIIAAHLDAGAGDN